MRDNDEDKVGATPLTHGDPLTIGDNWFDRVEGGCLLPLPVMDMSNGVVVPIDKGIPAVVDWGPTVAAGVTAPDDVTGVGIVNDMPSSAAIGCHGLRADRFSSLPVILAFRSDLQSYTLFSIILLD